MSRFGVLKSDERGMVSFMVTLIMILVISLIVIGFAQVTRRSEREALDRQLSAQAFYAAESGVNVTRQKIVSYVSGGGTTLYAKDKCPFEYEPGVPGGDNGTVIQPLKPGAVQYTCVLVNPTPESIRYDVNQSGSVIVPIKTASAIDTLSFSWPKQGGTTDSNCNILPSTTFSPSASWTCGNGVIRVELMVTPGGAIDSNVLNSATKVLYLVPGSAGGSLNATGGAKVYVGSASGCSPLCTITVDVPDSASYFARITSIYREAAGLQISGTLAGGGAAQFLDAQAIVDVTGQAQDQLRRIQARVSLSNVASSGDVPLQALGSGGDICKRFSIVPTGSVSSSAICN